jgi:Ca-activated chloride channel family protein
MSFHSPHLLWLLGPLVLLFSWELARHRAQAAAHWPKIARAWAGAFHVSLGARHTTAETRPRLWLWLGLALCTLALARPQWGAVEEQVFDQSREVLVAVDLSKSMLAQDVKPSRLDRAKLLITSLLDGLKGERVGLVLFSGTAFLQSPLSADYEILREFLPSLNPDYLPEGGTNYQALLETSIQAFGTSSADRYLIVLSDGEATDETWKPLIEQMKTKGIRVIGLGIGTAQGSFIPDAGGSLAKDERGAVVLSRLNSSTLQELAQVTGGAYSDASAWIDLPALLRQTVEAGRKGQFSEKNTARLVERFQWFLAPGLLLLFASFWAEFPVRPRERALPLGRGKMTNDQLRMNAAQVLPLLVLASSFVIRHSSFAQEADSSAFAKPLSAAVARLSEKPALAAKDYAELAQTTLTYGQRSRSAQQQIPERVIDDALLAVDQGERIDAKAADWPRLRSELEELRKQQEEEKQQRQERQKQEQQKQEQQQNQQEQQQQNQDQQSPDQQKQQQSGQEKQEPQNQQQQKQDAFGDMKEQPDKSPQPPPQPQPQQTQKVGGQKEKKEERPLDPDLAMPLQKLEQVRNQDSPAKLQQLMQGQPQKQPKKGKDW